MLKKMVFLKKITQSNDFYKFYGDHKVRAYSLATSPYISLTVLTKKLNLSRNCDLTWKKKTKISS